MVMLLHPKTTYIVRATIFVFPLVWMHSNRVVFRSHCQRRSLHTEDLIDHRHQLMVSLEIILEKEPQLIFRTDIGAWNNTKKLVHQNATISKLDTLKLRWKLKNSLRRKTLGIASKRTSSNLKDSKTWDPRLITEGEKN